MENIKQFIKRYRTQIIYALITLALGGLSALITGGYETYEMLKQPPLSPPAWVFPVVWSILYLLIGVAAGDVASTNDLDKDKALKLYFLQLLINLFWPLIFFRFDAIKFALFWLVLLIITAILTLKIFYDISKKAGLMFLPYVIWLFFAFYLNFGVIILNS